MVGSLVDNFLKTVGDMINPEPLIVATASFPNGEPAKYYVNESQRGGIKEYSAKEFDKEFTSEHGVTALRDLETYIKEYKGVMPEAERAVRQALDICEEHVPKFAEEYKDTTGRALLELAPISLSRLLLGDGALPEDPANKIEKLLETVNEREMRHENMGVRIRAIKENMQENGIPIPDENVRLETGIDLDMNAGIPQN